MLDTIVIEVKLLEFGEWTESLWIERRYVVLSETQLPQSREPWKSESADGGQLGVYELYFLSTISCARMGTMGRVHYLCIVGEILENLEVIDVGLLLLAVLVLFVA